MNSITWFGRGGEMIVATPEVAILTPQGGSGLVFPPDVTSLIGFETAALQKILNVTNGPVRVALEQEATFTFPGGVVRIPYRERTKEDDLVAYLRGVASWDEGRWGGRSLLGVSALATVGKAVNVFAPYPVSLLVLGSVAYIKSQAVVMRFTLPSPYALPESEAVELPLSVVHQVVPPASCSTDTLYAIDRPGGGAPRLVIRYSPRGKGAPEGYSYAVAPLPAAPPTNPADLLERITPPRENQVVIKQAAEVLEKVSAVSDREGLNPVNIEISPTGEVSLSCSGPRTSARFDVEGEAHPCLWGKVFSTPLPILREVIKLTDGGGVTLSAPTNPSRGLGVGIHNLVVRPKGGEPLTGEGVVALISST